MGDVVEPLKWTDIFYIVSCTLSGSEVEAEVIHIEYCIHTLCKDLPRLYDGMYDSNFDLHQNHTVCISVKKNSEQHSPLHNLRDYIILLNI